MAETKQKPAQGRDFGLRLLQARKIKGLSLRELASSLAEKVSYNALHKYEQGEMLPSSDTLIKLSEVLGQPADFFFRPLRVSFDSIKFRKRATGIGAKSIESIREEAAEFFERYLEVEELLGVGGPFKNPIAGKNQIRNQTDVEKAAGALRDDWSLGNDALSSVSCLLEEQHILIYEVDADLAFSGFSGQAGEYPVIVINKNHSVDRKRFTALHELGHLLLELPDGPVTDKEIENFCNAFAGAMLLPADFLRRTLGARRSRITVDELKDIKIRMGVSCAAIMMRAERLGIFSQSQLNQFWRQWSQWGYRKKEPGECPIPEKAKRFGQLVFRGVAEELISETKGASLLKESLSEFRKRFKAAP